MNALCCKLLCMARIYQPAQPALLMLQAYDVLGISNGFVHPKRIATCFSHVHRWHACKSPSSLQHLWLSCSNGGSGQTVTPCVGGIWDTKYMLQHWDTKHMVRHSRPRGYGEQLFPLTSLSDAYARLHEAHFTRVVRRVSSLDWAPVPTRLAAGCERYLGQAHAHEAG